MTLKELSQLYWLEKEIELDEARLEQLRSERGVQAARITQLPRSPNSVSRVEESFSRIEEIEQIIREKRIRCIEERLRLEMYIQGIPDSLTRQIFTLRFVDFLSWTEVAARIGGGNTTAAVKKRVYRYLAEDRAGE